MSTSLEASTLNGPTTVSPSNSNSNPTVGSLDNTAAANSGLFVQRKRPVSLGSEADVSFKNIVQDYKQGMTPIRYYRRSTDCFPSTPDPDVEIPDGEFLVSWYTENHWKVDAHDSARNQLLEILAKYLPGYGLYDSDPLDAYISVIGHYIDELNTKLNEFDIDIGQISGGEIAGRIESHKTRVFFIISRYKRMLDSANETVYQLRDRIAHLDSELTGVLGINASLRRAMANGDPGVAATAEMEGRAAAALALSSNLQKELQRSRHESQQLYESINHLTNQSLNTHEECMQVLAGITQKVEINTMLEDAIRNHISQLGASMDQANRVVEDWYSSITRALSERDLEIAELQQRVQYKNNEIARLSAQHENLLRQSGELEDRVRRAKEAILMQEAELANMEELGVNRTFSKPMNFTYSSPLEGTIPCGFGPTESSDCFGGYLSSGFGGTFAIPAVNRTVTIPVVANTTVTVPTVNRTFTPPRTSLIGSPLNATQTVMTAEEVPSTAYIVQSPPVVLNTTGRVSPVLSEVSPAAVIGGGYIDESLDNSLEIGPSVGKVNNTIDIGKGLNMTTSISGSPRGLKQWVTVDNLASGSYSDSSPQAMNTTGSPRRFYSSSSGSGSPAAIIKPWYIDNSGSSFTSSGSCDGRYVDISNLSIPDEMVDDVFYLPGEPLEYSARLKNYRSANVLSYPRTRIYRKPSPGKSIRRLSERQCLTDIYAPTVDDESLYTTMNDLSSISPRGSYTILPKGTYRASPKKTTTFSPTYTEFSYPSYTPSPPGAYTFSPSNPYSSSVQDSGEDRLVNSPVALNTTVSISPRDRESSDSSAGSSPAVISMDNSYGFYGSSGSPPAVISSRYIDNSYGSSGSSPAVISSRYIDNSYGSSGSSPAVINPGYIDNSYGSYALSGSPGSPEAVIKPWFKDEGSFNSSGSCNGRYIDISRVEIPDEMVDDVFYLPGEPLEYPARLKNYRSANVLSYPRTRMYRKPSPGKSIRNLSERQCLTDIYAPTIDDLTRKRSTGSYTLSPRRTYSASPRGTYDASPTNTNFSYPSYTASPPGAYTFSPTNPYGSSTQDSPLKKSVLLQSPNRTAPFVLDIDVQPQPIIRTNSGDHIICDVSLDVQDSEPVLGAGYVRGKVFSYSTPPIIYSPKSPNRIGTPKSIFEKDYYVIRNLARQFDELENYSSPNGSQGSSICGMTPSPNGSQGSPICGLTPSPRSSAGESPDFERTY